MGKPVTEWMKDRGLEIPTQEDDATDMENIRSFMSDWEEARTYYSGQVIGILNLGVNYTFDKETRKDTVLIKKNQHLDFTNVSSGLQSLVPLWILLKYVTEGVYNEEWKDSELGKKKRDQVRKVIPMKYWVQFEDVGAWFVKNGTATSIMDKKLKQIKAEKIDEVSRRLNRDYDKLLDLEYEAD